MISLRFVSHSLLCDMRAGVHFELGKILSNQEQLESSLDHLEKAAELDCCGDHHQQINLVRNKVLLRSELYSEPEEPMQRAIKIIEQVIVQYNMCVCQSVT